MSDVRITATRARTQLFLGPTLPLAMLFLAVGCSRAPEDKLAGKWIGDRIDNVSADQVARATGWVKGTSMDFSGDKLTVTIPAEPARKGTFKVAKVEGEKMVLSVARSDGPTHDEAVLTLVDDKTMRWEIGQGREIVLVRSQ